MGNINDDTVAWPDPMDDPTRPLNEYPWTPKPYNTALPTISGGSTVGSLQTCSPGSWAYGPTYAYQWLRNGGVIAGATNSTYTTVAGDATTTLSCRVTATNASGGTIVTTAGKAIT